MSYRFPPPDETDGPWEIFYRVLDFPELALQANLVDADVQFAFVMRFEDDGWTRGGKRLLGTAQMPRVSGSLSGLFDQMLSDTLGFAPDFLIVLNDEFWADASPREREILVVHELMHCGQALDIYGSPRFNKQTGAPVLSMVAHDLEEFSAIVRRYGAWKGDIAEFLAAAAEGPQTPNTAPVPDVLAEIVREALDGMDLETATPAEVIARLDVEIEKLDSCDRLTQDESEGDVF